MIDLNEDPVKGFDEAVSKLLAPLLATLKDGEGLLSPSRWYPAERDFLWDSPSLYLDLTIEDGGTFCYYARLADGRDFAGDSVVTLPDEVMACLKEEKV